MPLNNLYPLWWIISNEAKELLKRFQEENYGLKIRQIEKPLPEVPVDWDKEIRKAPSRSRE